LQRAFCSHFRPQSVDEREVAATLDVPEHPPVAGLESLGERAVH
jgi:hypothetical protein